MGKQTSINRVKCMVDSCEHWDKNNDCVASRIEIKPPEMRSAQEADCDTETNCATFSPNG